jgi:hypothetical protein
MSKASSSSRWRLSVWFARGSGYVEFDFDGEPQSSGGQAVVEYHGEREGRTLQVILSKEGVSAWSLEEISR